MKFFPKSLFTIFGWTACSLTRGCFFLEHLGHFLLALLAGLALVKVLVFLKAALLGKQDLEHGPRTGFVVALMEDSQYCSCLSFWTCDIDGLVCVLSAMYAIDKMGSNFLPNRVAGVEAICLEDHTNVGPVVQEEFAQHAWA